jgi:hypothetical protein
MVSDSEKQSLRDDVAMFLQTKYNIEPQSVIHITNTILDIWFEELSTDCSYFTADNIADIIVDIYTRYYKNN